MPILQTAALGAFILASSLAAVMSGALALRLLYLIRGTSELPPHRRPLSGDLLHASHYTKSLLTFWHVQLFLLVRRAPYHLHIGSFHQATTAYKAHQLQSKLEQGVPSDLPRAEAESDASEETRAFLESQVATEKWSPFSGAATSVNGAAPLRDDLESGASVPAQAPPPPPH